MQKESNQQSWTARLQEQSGSGLSIRAWCVREGLTESTFHYWRKRLATPCLSATALIALPMDGRQATPALELQTPQGYLIRVNCHEQLGWVKSVIEALR